MKRINLKARVALSFFIRTTIYLFPLYLVHGSDLPIEQGCPSEALAGWQYLEQEYRKGFSATVRYSFLEDNKVKETRVAEVALKDTFELNTSDKKYLEAVNEKYTFFLVKNDPPDDSWIVKNLSFCKGEEIDYENDCRLFFGSIPIFKGLIMVDTWLNKLMTSDSFHILSIERRKDNISGKMLYEMEFDSAYVTSSNEKILHGHVVFISDDYWVIQSYNVDLETLPTATFSKHELVNTQASIEYQNVDGIPFPKTFKESYQIGESESYSLTYDILDVSRSEPDANIFYLSHYGLTEPNDPNRKYNLFRLLLAIIGVGLIGTGLYMRLKGINKTKTQL